MPQAKNPNCFRYLGVYKTIDSRSVRDVSRFLTDVSFPLIKWRSTKQKLYAISCASSVVGAVVDAHVHIIITAELEWACVNRI